MTICSFNNSGVITFDTDIEMEQGYWNTSSSRLWTRIRDLFHSELVEIYKDMRQNGFNYDKLMHYFYDEQIARIPESYYNKDYDVKYAPYADEYMGMANGSAYEHLKRWLKRRILFTDSLYDYVPSYADSITIRANTTEEMRIEIETYAPVYQHMSWYNNQMDKKKIDGKTAVTFTGKAQASTDQEVIIYGGGNLKRIRGISTMNPDSMIIGNASKLVELECNNAPLLTDINQNKANLSPNKYLTKVDISNCPQLGGTLRLNNSPLLQEVNAQGTAITGMLLPTSIKNLQTLKVPKGVTELTLNNAKTLTTLDLEEGYLLNTLSLSNCNKLKSFELSKVENINLDNSYEAEELRLSTNKKVSLKNMASLERLVYTPNSEIEEFDLTTLKNSPDVIVSSFNCPNLKEFMTTAPQRESYGECDNEIYPNKLFMANKLDLSDTQLETVKFLCTTDVFDLKLPTTMKNFYCDSAFDLDTSKITDGGYDVIHSDLIQPYTEEYNGNVYNGYNHTTEVVKTSRQDKLVYDLTYNTDYIPIKPGSEYTIKSSSFGWVSVIGFDKTKKVKTNIYKATNTNDTNAFNLTIPNDVYFVMFGAIGKYDLLLTYEKPYTPNIVPTSANGSLLFNINTTPSDISPYIWNLQGMKLNDFHTFGVNNKVSVKNIRKISNENIPAIYGKALAWGNDGTAIGLNDSTHNVICLSVSEGDNISYEKESEGGNSYYSSNGVIKSGNIGTNQTVSLTVPSDINYIFISVPGNTIIINSVLYYLHDNMIYDINALRENSFNIKNSSYTEKLTDLISITMPKRLADYKVQIKNADITPTNYNTMLYPKLVDTTLPITGKLDYSKYKGKYLSWAFAYTTDDVVRTALDSRSQGQIINDYNKLYSTDYVDIVDVWAYKDDNFSNRAINNNTTKAYIELTQDNYKSRIDEVLQWYPNCTELYLFEDGSVTDLSGMYNPDISANDAHGTKNQVKYVTFMEGYFNNPLKMDAAFRKCKGLIEIKRLPLNRLSHAQIFQWCENLFKVPETGWNGNMFYAFIGCHNLNCPISIESGINLRSIFNGCSSLTYTPILPSNYADSLEDAFQKTKITTAPVLPNGVTSLSRAFNGCTELTTVGNIPSSCNSYQNTFNGCTKLTSVPETGWKGNMSQTFESCTSLNQKITINTAGNLDSTFKGCSSLTITPTLPQKMNGSMARCFHSCSKLVTPPQTPEGVTNMGESYWNCISLVTAPIILNTVTDINASLYCTKITDIIIPIANLKSYGNALYSCNLLTDIDWTGKRTTDFSLTSLNCPSYTQEGLKDLVNNHLEDLYKDKVKISFGDKKVTINNTETTITT